jgi:hypothetical protein
MRHRQLIAIIILCFSNITNVASQTLGGSAIYNFLNLPPSTQLTALGGVNVSAQSNDLSLSSYNPALLRDSMEDQLSVNVSSLFREAKTLNLSTAFRHQRLQTNFAVGILWVDYGTVQSTDAAGNMTGEFKPADYSIQLQASRKYMQYWYYGLTGKLIHSNYGIYRSTGIAADFGVNYSNPVTGFQAGLTATNMGVQIRRYSQQYEDLPFDVRVGVSQRLKKIPLELSITAQQVHRLDIRYRGETASRRNSLFGKIIDHLIISSQLLLDDKIEITAGYNFLRASELKVATQSAGATGFSFGLGGIYRKMQLRYALSFYESTSPSHQIGINFNLKEKYF